MNYSTTWGTSLYLIESSPIPFSSGTIKAKVYISLSGEKIRLKLSNQSGKSDLEINSIKIANSISQGTGEIDETSNTPILFENKENIIIPAGSEVYSDIFSYPLKALSEVAISIYFGKVPNEYTGHEASMTYSFIEEGNKVNNVIISTKNKIAHYYFISLIETISEIKKDTKVCFGDSITDGVGSTNDRHNRYPDLLSTKLRLNKDTAGISVVNEGITSTRVTEHGIERYTHDVLDIKGVKYIIMLYGVNDINWLNSKSDEVISCYKKIIGIAHEKKLFIYGCTVLPYGNNEIWTKEREWVRNEVIDWIRNTKVEDGGFDHVFDFDKYVKDPNDDTKLYKEYDSGDGIHPGLPRGIWEWSKLLMI